MGLKVENKHDQLYTNSNLVSFAFKNGYSSIIRGTKPNGSKQFRLRIYLISETDSTYVGDDILNNNIFLMPGKGGWYQIKFQKEIPLPKEGFLIAIEWLKNQKIQHWGNKKAKYLSYDPNPTSGTLHFSERVEGFRLFSIEGRLLETQKNVRSADLAAWPVGLYFAEVIRGGQRTRYRIIRK